MNHSVDELTFYVADVLRADGIAPAAASETGVSAYLPRDNSEVIDLTDEEDDGFTVKREPKRERSTTFDNYSTDLTV